MWPYLWSVLACIPVLRVMTKSDQLWFLLLTFCSDVMSIHTRRSHVSFYPMFQVASPVVRMMKTRNPVGRAQGRCRACLACPGLQSLPRRAATQQARPPSSAHSPALQPRLQLASPAGSFSFPGDNRDNPSWPSPICSTTSDPWAFRLPFPCSGSKSHSKFLVFKGKYFKKASRLQLIFRVHTFIPHGGVSIRLHGWTHCMTFASLPSLFLLSRLLLLIT